MPTKITEDEIVDERLDRVTDAPPALEPVSEEDIVPTRRVTDGYGMEEFFEKEAKKFNEAKNTEGKDDTADDVAIPVAESDGEPPSTLDYLISVFQDSVMGLAIRGELPDKPRDPDATTGQMVIGELAQEAFDSPATIAGAVGGTLAAGPIGGFAGAVGLPLGLRSAMMEAYRTGEVDTSGEFLDVMTAFVIDGSKGAALGAAGGKVGQLVQKPAKALMKRLNITGKAAATATVGAQRASEVGTLITAASAIEGELPDSRDFIVAAGAVGGAQVGLKVTRTLRDVYTNTSVPPQKVSSDALKFADVKADIIGERSIPRRYRTEEPDPDLKLLEAREPKVETLSSDSSPLAKARSNIRSKVKSMKDVEALKAGVSIKTLLLDKLDPIKKAVRAIKDDVKVVEEDVNPYTRFRLLAGTQAKVADTLTNGFVDGFGSSKRVTKGIDTILKPAKENLAELNDYLIAKRAINVEQRGLKSGFNKSDAEAIVNSTDPKIAKVAKDLSDFQTQALKYLRDAGVISSQDYKSMIEAAGDSYVPFHRVIENSDGSLNSDLSSNSIKKFKGSDKDIINPLEVIPKNVAAAIRTGDLNMAMKSFADDFAGTYFLKPSKLKPGQKPSGNQIVVFENGKRKVYETTADIKQSIDSLTPDQMPDFVKYLSQFARIKRIGITNSLSFMMPNFIRGEISTFFNNPDTYFPIFDGLMGVRGLVTAKKGLKKQQTGDKLTKAEKKHVDLITKWMQSGGAGATFMEADRLYLRSGVQKTISDTGGPINSVKTAQEASAALAKVALNTVKIPLRGLENIAIFTENAPRFRTFQKAQESGRDLTVSSLLSRESALDFAKVGNSKLVRGLRATSAFLGAALNAADKAGRLIKERPRKTSHRAFWGVTLSTAAVHIWNHYEKDQETGEYKMKDWYKNGISKTNKDLYYNVLVPETDYVIRVPRGFDIALGASLATESFIDFMFEEDKESFKDVASVVSDTFFGGAVQAAIPDAVEGIVEVGINKSFFTGNPIVRRGDEGLVADMQASPSTTQISREVSSFLSRAASVVDEDLRRSRFLSAAAVDHYITSWTGTLGRSTLRALDDVLQETGVIEKRPQSRPRITDVFKELAGVEHPFEDELTPLDIPIVRSFFARKQSLSAESIAEMFQKIDRTNMFFDSVKRAAKTGKASMAKEILREARAAGQFLDTSSLERTISDQFSAINKINNIPDDMMPPIEKREAIDNIIDRMIKMSVNVNQRMEDAMEIMQERFKEEGIPISN